MFQRAVSQGTKESCEVLLTISVFNDRLCQFDFGYTEISDKPSELVVDSLNKKFGNQHHKCGNLLLSILC